MTGRAWVITGAGVVSTGGDTPGSILQTLIAGEPVAAPAPAAGRFASARVEDFDPKKYVQRRGLRDLSRTSQLACAAAAPVSTLLSGVGADDVGVVLGSAWGSARSVVEFERQASRSFRLVDPLLFAETVANVPAGQVSVIFGWAAFNATISCGSASGLEAIREAITFLSEDRAAAAVAGGADEANDPILPSLGAQGLIAAGAASAPFSKERAGPASGEGGCLIAIEERERARARGAPILGRVRASVAGAAGARGGARDVASALEALLREALAEAGWRPGEVDLVVSSADGWAEGDRAEAEALAAVFGEGAGSPLVLAPKGILGESWGASGPIGAVAAIEIARAGVVPGQPRGFAPDPDLPRLNLPASTVEARVRRSVILARAAGGHLSALLLDAQDGGNGL